MKFVCPACGKVLKRDMRLKITKLSRTKRGIRSYCEEKGRNVYCREVAE